MTILWWMGWWTVILCLECLLCILKTIKNALKLSKTWFKPLFIMLMRDSCVKTFDFKQNLSGATSFWVSNSVWESLLNVKNIHFCSSFYVSLTWISCTHDEKSIFWWFSSIFYRFRPCKRMRKIHNKCPLHSMYKNFLILPDTPQRRYNKLPFRK